MTSANDLSPYGRHAPRGLVAFVLGLTRQPRLSWLGRRLNFMIRAFGILLLRGQPQDVSAFGAQMRLYPAHNVSEKNLLFTPHLFDPDEREILGRHVCEGFTFVDIGANVGGYALFVAALAGPHARILAIEPQPEIFERLVFNVRQNPFGSIKALECAVADQDGDITMFLDTKNSGESSMRFVTMREQGKSVRVAGKTLATILAEERLDRLDALKIDVEGAEELVLDPFFRDMPQRLWPTILIVDNSAAQATDLIAKLGQGQIYRKLLRTRSNDVFERVGCTVPAG